MSNATKLALPVRVETYRSPGRGVNESDDRSAIVDAHGKLVADIKGDPHTARRWARLIAVAVNATKGGRK